MSSLNVSQGPVRPRFSVPGGARAPARSGHDPVPQGALARHPRLRRRVQRGRQPGGLLRAADRHRHGDGQLPASASWCRRASARRASRRFTSGSSTTACAGRTSPRSTATAAMASGRRWSSTTAPTRPAPCSSRAISTGPGIFGRGVRWFHSGGIFAALSETTSRADHRGHAGRQGRRRRHLVRPELPGQAVGLGRRAERGQQVHQPHRRQRRRPDRQRGGPAEGARHHGPGGRGRSRSSIPTRSSA